MSQQANSTGLNDSFPEKYGKTLKVVSIICGGVLFLLAIINFFSFAIEDPIDIILPLYYVQIVFSMFGTLIISAEFNIKFIVKYFYFISGYIGRGCFYIFVGILCIHKNVWYQFLIAGVLLIVGCVYICCYCNYKDPNQAEPQNENNDARQGEFKPADDSVVNNNPPANQV